MNRRIALVGTYPPCECGIATYTKDLFDALSCYEARNPPVVIAIDENNFQYHYEGEVEYLMKKDLFESYVKAAEFVNDSDIDVVSLQHEFGLFGGTWGENIISVCRNLNSLPSANSINLGLSFTQFRNSLPLPFWERLILFLGSLIKRILSA